MPRSLFESLGALGACGFDAPEKYGGAGENDLRYNAILAEEACDLTSDGDAGTSSGTP